MEDAAKLAPLALVVMVVDLLESTSIARALAAKGKYELSANQVCVSVCAMRDPCIHAHVCLLLAAHTCCVVSTTQSIALLYVPAACVPCTTAPVLGAFHGTEAVARCARECRQQHLQAAAASG
jgi:hypothetical protein